MCSESIRIGVSLFEGVGVFLLFLCTVQFSSCQLKAATTSLNISNTIADKSSVLILQLNDWTEDSTRMTISTQQFITIENNTSKIFFADGSFPNTCLLKIYRNNHVNHKRAYDIFVIWQPNILRRQNNYISMENRCYHVEELKNLIPFNYESDQSLNQTMYTLKFFHQPCQHLNISCFYDEQAYFCRCHKTYRSAICGLYDFFFERCDYCMSII